MVLLAILLLAWYLPKVKVSFEERLQPKPLPEISYQVPDSQSGPFVFKFLKKDTKISDSGF